MTDEPETTKQARTCPFCKAPWTDDMIAAAEKPNTDLDIKCQCGETVLSRIVPDL